MRLYLISQDHNNDYDTYDSAIVATDTKAKAIKIHPGGGATWGGTWCPKKYVKAEFIGTARKGTKEGVILASFNAG